ncbi:MAG TPA: DUF222 domain-containing protein [Nocardioidaceae bacterium]|nr:DUF222 domain-containing protein [Nocardioidaceae bacterium]
MFDHGWADRLHETVAEGAALDLVAASREQLRELVVGQQAAIDRLQASQSRALAEFEAREGHRPDGCSSMAAWMRRYLQMSGAETQQRRRAAVALIELPSVRAAVEAGRIRPAHVDVFATGVKRLGAQLMRDHQDILLPVAEACDPTDLLTAVDRLRDTIDPDAADRDWIAAQEKYDFTLRRVGHGWDVSGYLGPETGTMLKQVLDSAAAPNGVGDQRPVAQRRVEGLHHLLGSILDSGLPSDKGIRPHLAVNVDVKTLRLAVGGDRTTPAPPAFLAGYGHIGRALLTETTDAAGRSPYGHVLDVGRTQRLATAKQRLAVLVQQNFRCANPGCTNTYLEIHHIVAWLDGGPTDMDNLCGLCVPCHHLVHAELLICSKDADGALTFRSRDGTPLTHSRRQALADFHRALDPPPRVA